MTKADPDPSLAFELPWEVEFERASWPLRVLLAPDPPSTTSPSAPVSARIQPDHSNRTFIPNTSGMGGVFRVIRTSLLDAMDSAAAWGSIQRGGTDW